MFKTTRQLVNEQLELSKVQQALTGKIAKNFCYMALTENLADCRMTARKMRFDNPDAISLGISMASREAISFGNSSDALGPNQLFDLTMCLAKSLDSTNNNGKSAFSHIQAELDVSRLATYTVEKMTGAPSQDAENSSASRKKLAKLLRLDRLPFPGMDGSGYVASLANEKDFRRNAIAAYLVSGKVSLKDALNIMVKAPDIVHPHTPPMDAFTAKTVSTLSPDHVYQQAKKIGWQAEARLTDPYPVTLWAKELADKAKAKMPPARRAGVNSPT